MGTENINNMILGILLEKQQTLSEIQKSLGKGGKDFSEDDISVSLSRLNRRGYIDVASSDSKDAIYVLTALGQGVSIPKK